MPEKHTVSTPHGTLQFEGHVSNGEKVVLVTIAKPFFPAFGFCLSLPEMRETTAAMQDAIEEAEALELPR